MIALSKKILSEIADHASRDYPRESCGLVIIVRGKHKYIPCRNTAASNQHFIIHPEDQQNAEDQGEIAMVVHSHPNIPPVPSQADLVWCERTGLPWLIINWPTGQTYQFEPTGFVLPLTGRVYVHGAIDCYQLIADYYQRELSIELPDPDRSGQWWLNGKNLYLDNYKDAGFHLVDSPKRHDVILMRVASPVPNHGAVCLGDGTILHHQMNRLSSKDVYGGWFRKCTTHILRHEAAK